MQDETSDVNVGQREPLRLAKCGSEKCGGKYTWQVVKVDGRSRSLACGNCGAPYKGTALVP